MSKTPEQRLRSIITTCLGGPSGDPDYHHCMAAAHACVLLREMGHPQEETEENLRNNPCYEGIDFIARAG